MSIATNLERRAAAGEVRAEGEGRRLVGTVLRFGDVSPTHRERFEAGSIVLADTVHLDLAHDRDKAIAWRPGGGLELRDDGEALLMVADVAPVPAGDKALAAVRSGALGGLSIEFRSRRETRAHGLRVIQAALLTGVGLVARPSYEDSRVEARARARRIWL